MTEAAADVQGAGRRRRPPPPAAASAPQARSLLSPLLLLLCSCACGTLALCSVTEAPRLGVQVAINPSLLGFSDYVGPVVNLSYSDAALQTLVRDVLFLGALRYPGGETWPRRGASDGERRRRKRRGGRKREREGGERVREVGARKPRGRGKRERRRGRKRNKERRRRGGMGGRGEPEGVARRGKERGEREKEPGSIAPSSAPHLHHSSRNFGRLLRCCIVVSPDIFVFLRTPPPRSPLARLGLPRASAHPSPTPLCHTVQVRRPICGTFRRGATWRAKVARTWLGARQPGPRVPLRLQPTWRATRNMQRPTPPSGI